MRKHISIVSLGFVGGLLLYFFFLNSGDISEEPRVVFIHLISCGIVGITISYITYFLASKFDAWIPWNQQLGLRLLLGIIISTVTAVLLSWLAINSFCLLTINKSFSFSTHFPQLTKLTILFLVIMICFNIIYFAFYSYTHYAKVQILKIKEEREQVGMQLSALKSQLSPHFLFNCLNTISSLAYKDKQKAELFIRKMAASYQYILGMYNHKLISIGEEIEFVNDYLFLLKTRFENAINLELDIDPRCYKNVIPPLSIQLLIENAVKHNQVDIKNPLTIKIKNDKSWLIIENNKTKTMTSPTSFGIGLTNIKTRFKLLSDRDVIVENKELFTVKLPLII